MAKTEARCQSLFQKEKWELGIPEASTSQGQFPESCLDMIQKIQINLHEEKILRLLETQVENCATEVHAGNEVQYGQPVHEVRNYSTFLPKPLQQSISHVCSLKNIQIDIKIDKRKQSEPCDLFGFLLKNLPIFKNPEEGMLYLIPIMEKAKYQAYRLIIHCVWILSQVQLWVLSTRFL